MFFFNDNNVEVILPDHPFVSQILPRNNAEPLFRRINTFLINHNIITNNIIDLGCWIGDNSIPWAKNINGMVYAIDPSPENCEFIKLLASTNNISNIKIIQKAISDHNELLSTNDSLNHCSFVYPPIGITGKTKLNAVSLDYLYQQKELENIGYIHLAVEGMEFKVIMGADNIIKDFRPIITFEQHLEIDDYLGLTDYLKNKKYEVFLIDETLAGCRPDCRNLIAFPKEKFSSDLIGKIHDYLSIPDLIKQL